MFSVTAQIVKHNYLVTDINDLARIVKEAFFICADRSPRACSDRYSQEHPDGRDAARFSRPRVKLRGYNPIRDAEDVDIHELVGLIRSGKKADDLLRRRRVTGDASAELKEFAERSQIPWRPRSWASAASPRVTNFRSSG